MCYTKLNKYIVNFRITLPPLYLVFTKSLRIFYFLPKTFHLFRFKERNHLFQRFGLGIKLFRRCRTFFACC